MATERKKLLLRLDPAVHDALARWAGDELRSTNAQIEYLLRKALGDAGRLPGGVGRMRGPGRPPGTPVPGAGQADDGAGSFAPDGGAPAVGNGTPGPGAGSSAPDAGSSAQDDQHDQEEQP
ncbi:hypothetical protein Aph02nite_32370 [Actinoplanes philippinensis]|uniref:HicB family protein n=1 Tax=Actinoplanes philippinensis TaxID=35752 RepID=A0A1I2E5D2_9ACTN|nr:hypothetical protein [Actinoplanes philippinensis]GIE77287.1 hypothetical protein Aph02nite_32370 [Actinoplanes philippinensis]SFE87480.1 hypothetical protein SAMN05421541_104167 [Actinoplanes philippinensis]